MKVEGQCHCGAIAYEAQVDPANVAICHCTDCQQLTGTAFRVSVRAERRDFALLRGEPRAYVKMAESGAKRLQAFCADCGTPLYACDAHDDASPFGLRWGAIRQRRDLVPTRQIWCRSALEWTQDISTLPGAPVEA
ncbi:GFA family protein [Pararhizobium haloflavum]|uniref:GFA family protein n=1 Tax=Pararhizobium haloflavum TaxID=2037914 RepID=UPI000C18BED9|nr:GFA family protein [Pararhizobium haloflavum]